MESITKLIKKLRREAGEQEAEKGAQVAIDFPQQGERIVSPDYTFRIGAKTAGAVEISIDGGEWRPCREAEGYWWYDWSGYEPGKHKAVARVHPENGREIPSETRRFVVEF